MLYVVFKLIEVESSPHLNSMSIAAQMALPDNLLQLTPHRKMGSQSERIEQL